MTTKDGGEAVREVIDTLEDAGFEVTSGIPGHGTCERCGIQDKESRMGGCFVCGMWEDPESSDKEIRDGTKAAYEYNHTLDMWLAGRKQWGHLYPPPELVERIWRDIVNHATEEQVRLNNWFTANGNPNKRPV